MMGDSGISSDSEVCFAPRLGGHPPRGFYGFTGEVGFVGLVAREPRRILWIFRGRSGS
jgi:hypothetical protein